MDVLVGIAEASFGILEWRGWMEGMMYSLEAACTVTHDVGFLLTDSNGLFSISVESSLKTQVSVEDVGKEAVCDFLKASIVHARPIYTVRLKSCSRSWGYLLLLKSALRS